MSTRRPPRPDAKQRRMRQRLSTYRAQRAGRRRRPIPRAAVPSFFTLMNLFSGFLALTQMLEGAYVWACWLIVLAAFFDALDGMMARLTNGTSAFGIELDSLCDVVSFGVAPAFLVYTYGLREFGTLGLLVASLPAICGAVRLARFNVGAQEAAGEKKDYFSGLPIPGQAMAIVVLILNFDGTEWVTQRVNDLSILMPIVFVLSGLMVSTIRFDAIPKPTVGYIRAHPRKSMAYLLAVVVIVVLQQIGLLIVLIVYLAHGIGGAVYRVVQAVLSAPGDGEPAPAER